MFSQPVFHMIEEALAPRIGALHAGGTRACVARLLLRSVYVVCTTLVACAMPFFSGARLGAWRQLVCECAAATPLRAHNVLSCKTCILRPDLQTSLALLAPLSSGPQLSTCEWVLNRSLRGEAAGMRAAWPWHPSCTPYPKQLIWQGGVPDPSPPPPPPLSPAHSPIAMYNKVHSPPLWQRTIMGTVNVVCFVVSVLAVVGSAYNIAEDASTYKMFGGRR